MKYAVKQVTTYNYASAVPFAKHVLRLTPMGDAGQTVLANTITIDPAPRERQEDNDFFGNRVTHIAFESPHLTMTITCEAAIEKSEAVTDDLAATPTWTTVRDAVPLIADLSPRAPTHYIFASRFVPIDPTIRDYAGQSFTPDRSILEAGLDLAMRIKADFAYDPAATDVTTPTTEAFSLKRGVCQDFAHVMIAGLRGLGLPAAYVSGYLRTEPPPGKPRLAGADATHAWVSLWCGEAIGWRGLDPTNGITAGGDHLTLAFGRDYADVSPVDGVIVADGGHTLSVAVDVVPEGETLPEEPPRLS
ncbi:MAG TPA: transglutaminase family protein [Magnetospirillaceae bacterium]|jgi:transglutaminase-like putative cysteine protease